MTKCRYVRFPLAAGPLVAPDTIVNGLPTRGHSVKTVVIGADNTLSRGRLKTVHRSPFRNHR